MLCQGTMTGFAIHVGVLAGLLRVQNVCVTGLAGIVSGKMDRTGGHLSDRRAAVVAVFSKTLRYNEVADHEEKGKRCDEQKRKPQKMSCIFEEIHRTLFPSRGGPGLAKLFNEEHIPMVMD